jgi:mannan endo-1,4-beta-mannosidase
VVEELEKRRMVGIVVLTNFWQWSGGMAQYVAWAGGGPIPYPTPDRGGDWGRFQDFAARFYETAAAREAFGALVRRLVPPLHRHASVVWELANEPRGVTRVPAYRRWIDETARLIKSLAPGQLVTTGSEGETAWPALAGLDVVEDHRSAAIDFATCHLWAQNWGWVSTETLAADFGPALDRALSYVTRHAELAAKLGKPIVLEEFGFPRDGGAFDAAAPTALRDRYFEAIYSAVHTLASTTPMAGIMPWAWAGACQPPRPGELWRPGDPLSGDPPHEPQGWYGIGEGDSTLRVIREGSARLAALPGA